MSESNAVLAERFRANDQRAFAKLFGRHHSLVFHVCLRMLGHRQDAEDVTQETFSRMARYIDRWDPTRPLEPWLLKIAGNRCRTFLQQRQQRQHQSLTSSSDVAAEDLSDVQATLLREELDRALSHLPPHQARAFQLFHNHGMSYAQIAAELDCPLGTVKTWVHRTRLAVVHELQQRGVLESVEVGS